MNTKAANCCKTISVYNNLLHTNFVKCKVVQYRLQSYSVYHRCRQLDHGRFGCGSTVHGRFGNISCISRCNSTSTEPSVKRHPDDIWEREAQEGDLFEGGENRIKRRPFVKDFFHGRVDVEVLAYPEILKRAKLDNLREYVARVRPIFHLEGNVCGDELLALVREQRLWGAGVPKANNGIELNATQTARVCEEFYADRTLGAQIIAHITAAQQCVVPEATKAVRDHYLPLVVTGECILAPCMFDPITVDGVNSDNNKAALAEDEKTYLLTGTKRILKTKFKPGAYIVFMKSEIVDERTGLQEDELTGFLVDSNSSGISLQETPAQEGYFGDEFVIVEFSETPVPVSHVIGQPGKALPILMNLLGKIRLYSSAMNTGLLRGFIGWCMMELDKSPAGKLESGGVSELVTRVLAQCSSKLYGMESMIHFTAGLIDTKEQDDTSMEEAMCKLYSSEECWRSIDEALHVFTQVAPVSDLPTYEKYYKDARAGLFHEEGNEPLRMYIYCTAMKHYGDALRDEVLKMRNPLFHPWDVIKWTFKYRRILQENPKLDMKLDHYVHPSLKLHCASVEYGIKHLEYASRLMLVRWGTELTEKLLEGRRLADASTAIFAAVAAIAHSNRSYCIGLRNADLELVLAEKLSIHDMKWSVDTDLKDIIDGEVATTDQFTNHLMTIMVDQGEYVAQHTLTDTTYDILPRVDKALTTT